MMRSSILSLFLLAAPAFANLRGAVPPTQLRRAQEIELEDNEFAFIVSYFLTMESNANQAEQQDFSAFRDATGTWLVNNVMYPVLTTDAYNEFSLDTFYNDPKDSFYGCVSQLEDAAWDMQANTHRITQKYICKFTGVDKPATLDFLDALEAEAGRKQAALDLAMELSGSSVFSQTASITTTEGTSLSWVSVGRTNRNDQFEYGFVLPYVITWSFTTTPDLAVQVDFEGCRNATKEWVETQWDVFYNDVNPKFARRTVDVSLRYTSFSPMVEIYQQSVTLGVEILIGADNITDVPTVSSYATAMQLYYPISNFTNLIEMYLPEGAVLSNSTQTTYAIAPTFEVMELSQSKQRNEPGDIDMVNYAVVSVNL